MCSARAIHHGMARNTTHHGKVAGGFLSCSFRSRKEEWEGLQSHGAPARCRVKVYRRNSYRGTMGRDQEIHRSPPKVTMSTAGSTGDGKCVLWDKQLPQDKRAETPLQPCPPSSRFPQSWDDKGDTSRASGSRRGGGEHSHCAMARASSRSPCSCGWSRGGPKRKRSRAARPCLRTVARTFFCGGENTQRHGQDRSLEESGRRETRG